MDSSALRNRVLGDAHPLAWARREGVLPHPYPGNWIIFIALENLDVTKGLPLSNECTHLNCGDYVILSGNENLNFGNSGGGMAFFMRVKA